ncbi:MAG: sigma-54-dependent Fis family transcriptional regulator [Deltaproteobacteria bacterium]|nr:sigma-54-dependent Fis family transcriptional regulator [Deltaproteobacteria bacterium]MBW2034283.1 sigma-54-dependent Fis family transcriptional regulator [Deltaproteobacteria bacterium]
MITTDDLIVGVSESIRKIHELIPRVADINVAVLVSGESGTGKTLAAMAISQMSQSAHESLLQFNCAATSGRFMEMALFGIEKDANLETSKTKKGLLESASDCSVLLENIDQIPFELQIKLLRVFQERKFNRIGGKEDFPIKCRIICTSVCDMEEKVLAGLFREDLFYRVNVINIRMPALRERPEDIEPLIYEFIVRLGKDPEDFLTTLQKHDLLDYFVNYSWPGNVRELQQIVETIVINKNYDSIKELLLGHGGGSNKIVLERYIEFPPEYHQAGVSIMSFFGEILRRKYPEHKATVKIEQDGLRVRMIVEPLTGKAEVFERALDEYGLVLTGQITPDEFTKDQFLAINLKHELRLAQARIESQKELLHYQEINLRNQENQIDQLMNLIGKALNVPAPHHIEIEVSLNISPSISFEVSVSSSISYILDDLKQLGGMLDDSSNEAEVVEETRQEIEKIDKNDANKIMHSSAFNKLRKIIENINDTEGRTRKTLSTVKEGVATAQRLAKHYNQIAQWCGLPQVPKPFLGSGKNV